MFMLEYFLSKFKFKKTKNPKQTLKALHWGRTEAEA